MLYRVYGLIVGSNRPLVGLVAEQSSAAPDIHIEFDPFPPGPAPESPAIVDSAPHRNAPGESARGVKAWWEPWPGGLALRIRFSGGGEETEAVIDPLGKSVRIAGTQRYSPLETYSADYSSVVLGSLIVCTLRMRGHLCLHAGVVADGDGAILILGEPGAGKSTCTAALVRYGFRLVADDAAVIDEDGDAFLVRPAYPRLRLWADSARALLPATVKTTDLPRVLSHEDRYFVDVGVGAGAWTFQPTPLPVKAIYVLTRREDRVDTSIEPVLASEKLTLLLAYRSVKFAPVSEDRRRREFAGLAGLARSVPIRKVCGRSGLDRLDRLTSVLAADILAVGAPAPSTVHAPAP